MAKDKARVFHPGQQHQDILSEDLVAVLGYGNQGRAQALNLRDNGLKVIIGNKEDRYHERAREDGFQVFDIHDAVKQADDLLVLIPDEVLPEVFSRQIKAHLKPGNTLSFASGYTVAFDLIELPTTIDVILIAPRMIGVGVRERFLTKEGFYCFVGVHQDYSGKAEEKMLALTHAIGGLLKPAVELTFKQEAVLDLFNEQAFGPAFGRVLLTAISVLTENGIPPEAALVEMYMSEEMSYTYQKMAKIGLVKQTLFHSHTSQYGAMSRGIRFMDLDFKPRMQKIFNEIDSGNFATEWQNPLSRLKFKAIRFFAMRQFINKLEARVRESLGFPEIPTEEFEPIDEKFDLLEHPKIQAELEAFKESLEY